MGTATVPSGLSRWYPSLAVLSRLAARFPLHCSLNWSLTGAPRNSRELSFQCNRPRNYMGFVLREEEEEEERYGGSSIEVTFSCLVFSVPFLIFPRHLVK